MDSDAASAQASQCSGKLDFQLFFLVMGIAQSSSDRQIGIILCAKLVKSRNEHSLLLAV